MKAGKFIQNALAVGLACTVFGLSTRPIQAKEKVFEAVRDGIDA